MTTSPFPLLRKEGSIVRALRDCLYELLDKLSFSPQVKPSSIADITLVSEVFRLPKPPSELRLDNLLQIQLADGTFHYLQIEIQAQNDPQMGWRMLRYFHAAVSPLSGREYPSDDISSNADHKEAEVEPQPKLNHNNFSQLVMYVGPEPMRMPNELFIDQKLHFSYQLVDVRNLEAETLLESKNPGAILFGFLAKNSCSKSELQAIIERLKSLSSHEDLRNELLADLYFISRLRGLQLEVSNIIGEKQMSIIIPKEYQEIDYLFIKGKIKALLTTGLKMYRMGYSLEEIQAVLELSPDLYQKLLEKIQAEGNAGL